MGALSYKGAKIITFPPKPDGQTDIRTDRRTYGKVDKIFFCQICTMDLTVKALEQFGMELVPGHIEFGNI